MRKLSLPVPRPHREPRESSFCKLSATTAERWVAGQIGLALPIRLLRLAYLSRRRKLRGSFPEVDLPVANVPTEQHKAPVEGRGIR